ncbi:hypothetical protein UNDKW_5272 [Undibacterium sp. KW1]|nr:hypothetical protein UNDKW_5272 [Undibacterium sp. KW1]
MNISLHQITKPFTYFSIKLSTRKAWQYTDLNDTFKFKAYIYTVNIIYALNRVIQIKRASAEALFI